MKKYLFFSLILLNSLIFKSLGATDNSLENPYKIVERKSPEKHFTVNKENLLELFDLEPEKVIVEMELPYLNRTEKFELEKTYIHGEDNMSFTITTAGYWFSTKTFNGVGYNINDLNGVTMGTMRIYPNNVNINLKVNGEEIRIEKDFNDKKILISKNDINNKNTEDFKNIKDIIAKIDKLKSDKSLTKQDLSAMKEIKDSDKQKQEESKQKIKAFKNDELLGPAPPPIDKIEYCVHPFLRRCQRVTVNYMISYEMYLKWQTPVFDIINGKLTLKDTAIKKTYNEKAVRQVKQKLDLYFDVVERIFQNEGINVVMGTVVVETESLESRGNSSQSVFLQNWIDTESDSELDYNVQTFRNQYLNGNREWKKAGGGWGATAGAFKDIPKTREDWYVRGKYVGYDLWSCGRTNTGGIYDGIIGLEEIITDLLSTVADDDTSFVNEIGGGLSRSSSQFFNRTPFIRKKVIEDGQEYTIGYSLFDFYEGIWFYIGDIVPSKTNEGPAMSWKEFIRGDNDRAEIIRYSGQNNDDEWTMKQGWGITGTDIKSKPGSFNYENYLPMIAAPKDISDDNTLNFPRTGNASLFGDFDPFDNYFDLSKTGPNRGTGGFDQTASHLQPIGITAPFISTPNQIYGSPNHSNFVDIPSRLGIIPLLGNMWHHTFDLENVNTKYFDILTNSGDWVNGDAINYKMYPFHKYTFNNITKSSDTVLQWNYHDVQELFGTTGQFGNSNHLSYNIDKWNVWMLVHNIAVTLGPRYFTTKTNRNTILAPLARNYNYDADNYTYANGTPHISNRPVQPEPNIDVEKSWIRTWWEVYGWPTINYDNNPNLRYGSQFSTWNWLNLVGIGNLSYVTGVSIWGKTGTGTSASVKWWQVTKNFYGWNMTKKAGTKGIGSVVNTSGKVAHGGGLSTGAVLGAAIIAIVVYIGASMLTQGLTYGWSRDDLAPPDVTTPHPYIYKRHIESSNESGDNYDRDNWGEEGSLYIGWQNWDARYSYRNLELITTMCPVDLVSFSKGFDKKTSDLIRLNLMGASVNGESSDAVNDCNCNIEDCYRWGFMFFPGRINPHSTISLWHNVLYDNNTQLNRYVPVSEYQFAGDTIYARNNVLSVDYPNTTNNFAQENVVPRKNNTLVTEANINLNDDLEELDNWYGKQMKVTDFWIAGRIDSTGYNWTANNSNLTVNNFPMRNIDDVPLQDRTRNRSRARIILPNTNVDSSLVIYPVTLRITDTAGCRSNTAVKYIRVYPRKELPVRNSFIYKLNGASTQFLTLHRPFGIRMNGFTYRDHLLNDNRRFKYDQYDLNKKNLHGTRLTGLKNWEFIGPWSTGEGPWEASTWPNGTGGYYNRGMKPWSPSRISNTGWGIANQREDDARIGNGGHPVFIRERFQNSKFNNSWIYAGYVDNFMGYSTLCYFPIRNTQKQAIARKSVGDPNLNDERFDKTYNYGLGANDGGGVFFKNEYRPFYRAYASRGEKPWNNWASNIYEYYRSGLFFQGTAYINNDDETIYVNNLGGGRLPSNAKSPIKYFYGRNNLEFKTNNIITRGARATYNDEFVSDNSNRFFGQGPEQWAHSRTWFHERDYVWINRVRANRIYPEMFGEGGDFYRLRPIIQTPPFNINWYDPITRINNTYDFWTLSYIWGTNDVNYDNEQTIRNDYYGSNRKFNYNPVNYLNSSFGSLQDMPENTNLTYYRYGTSDTARSPLYFNTENNNNYLRFKLSYSYFHVDSITNFYASTGDGRYRWNLKSTSFNNNHDSVEIWARGVRQPSVGPNGFENINVKRLIFKKRLSEMSTYKENIKFTRVSDPNKAITFAGNQAWRLRDETDLDDYYAVYGQYVPNEDNNWVKTTRPGYVLEPIVEYDSVPTPIGTVAWFPSFAKSFTESEPIKIFHEPMGEYLQNPNNNNRFYKNTIEWKDIDIDMADFDQYQSLQFDIVYKNDKDFPNQFGSTIKLGSMEIETGRNLPLPLCEGGIPTIEFLDVVNDSLPPQPNVGLEDRIARWRLTSPTPNNVARYEIYKRDNFTDPNFTLIAQGSTNQVYDANQNNITNNGTYVGPIIAQGSINTTIGNTYTLQGIVINQNTVNLPNYNGPVTNPQFISVITPSTYAQRIPKRKPFIRPDSAFNFDGSFKITATFNRFNIKSNIENFILQKATINTFATGEADTTWQNVGSTLTYTNCTPAMSTNIKFFNFSTECSYTYNINSLPNSTTPLPNGNHLYRFKLTSREDKPSVEYTESILVVICRTCTVPTGSINLFVINDDSLAPNGDIPQLSNTGDYNFGNYNLFVEVKPTREGELSNISFVDIYERSRPEGGQTSPLTFIKRVNISQLYNAFFLGDSLRNKKQGAYEYVVRAFSSQNNVSYPLAQSNLIQVKVQERPCIPLYGPVVEQYTDILNFDLESSCPLTKYRVSLYKLENSSISGVDTNGNEVSNLIDASDEFLTKESIVKLNVNSTPITRFQNDEIADFTLRFTSQEITNKFFSRLINPKPAVLNNWYRIDVICTSCSSNQNNIKSTYYYFKND